MIAEEKILELFLFHNKLKFNEIEKLTKMRSNKLDYHLKKLITLSNVFSDDHMK